MESTRGPSAPAKSGPPVTEPLYSPVITLPVFVLDRSSASIRACWISAKLLIRIGAPFPSISTCWSGPFWIPLPTPIAVIENGGDDWLK